MKKSLTIILLMLFVCITPIYFGCSTVLKGALKTTAKGTFKNSYLKVSKYTGNVCKYIFGRGQKVSNSLTAIKQGSETIGNNCLKETKIQKMLFINSRLAGEVHPVTGIPFIEKTIFIGGQERVCGFPQFPTIFETRLPDNLLKATRGEHFTECNKKLLEEIERNSSFTKQFNDNQLERIRHLKTPPGFTWHHNEEVGVMQLVDAKLHEQTGHTGGYSIWGAGNMIDN